MNVSIPRHVLKILNLLEQNGATDVLIVGGFVRDMLLGIASKDVDVEVYGLSYAKIREILSPYFRVDIVGQAFGVMKVGHDVDVALPRRESKNGVGHKGFNIESTPSLSPQEAFSRRDFTINAIGLRRDGSYCDPFDGIGDLKRKILRATGPAFKDDPLRVLRGMQFAARLGFSTDEQTYQFCKEVLPEFSTLSEERVYEEWKKWALKGKYPSIGLEFLRKSGWTAAFPELQQLLDSPSDETNASAGKLWETTLAVCNEASAIVNDPSLTLSDAEKEYVMFSALTRLFLNSPTLPDENDASSQFSSVPSRRFFEKMKAPTRVLEAVEKLTTETTDESEVPDVRSIRRMAHRLSPANIKLWTLLRKAQILGNCKPEARSADPNLRNQIDAVEQRLLSAKAQGLSESSPKPVVNGRDLIPLGVKPGPQMGVVLKKAFEAQLDAKFSTTEDGVNYVRQSNWLN